MALRATPTIAICLTAGIAAGIALARPGGTANPAASGPVATPAPSVSAEGPLPDNESPYLVDAPAADAGESAAPPQPASVAISIEGFAFAPIGAVAPGAPIAVTNLDSADHTLTAVDGAFDTGTIGQNELVTIAAPATPGTYEFFCEIHPSMTGQLIVS